MASVSIAAAARRDIKEISSYLAEQGGFAPALAFSHSLDALRVRLGAHPLVYAIRESLGPFARVAVIAPYLIIYQHNARTDAVVILRVIHGRRKIPADFLKMQ